MKTFRAVITIEDALYTDIKRDARKLRQPVKDVLQRMAQATFEAHVLEKLGDALYFAENEREQDA